MTDKLNNESLLDKLRLAASKSIKNISSIVLNVLGESKENYDDNDITKSPTSNKLEGVVYILFIVVILSLSVVMFYIQIMALILSLRCNKGDTKWIHFALLLLLGSTFIFPLVYYIQMKDCKRVK